MEMKKMVDASSLGENSRNNFIYIAKFFHKYFVGKVLVTYSDRET